VRTDLAAFQARGLAFGEDAVEAARGTNTCFGGFVDGAAAQGFALVPILSVWATPSGLVTYAAFEELTQRLVAGLHQAMPLDGVLLALHGAMVSEEFDDADGEILRRVRAAVGPAVPVVATLDLHANVSAAMVAAADLLVGYDTYPHVDMAERAREAAGLLARLIRREVRPTPVLRQPPMLPTSQRMTTDREPMRGLIARSQAMESDPRVLNVSVAGGFPPADVPEAGLSILVATDGDPALAGRLADELAAAAWAAREGFLGGVSTWQEAAAAIGAEGRRGGGAGPTAPPLHRPDRLGRHRRQPVDGRAGRQRRDRPLPADGAGAGRGRRAGRRSGCRRRLPRRRRGGAARGRPRRQDRPAARRSPPRARFRPPLERWALCQ
jgi:microcystin degradation protein MlrC